MSMPVVEPETVKAPAQGYAKFFENFAEVPEPHECWVNGMFFCILP